jgi:hypothetical protein
MIDTRKVPVEAHSSYNSARKYVLWANGREDDDAKREPVRN